MKKNYINSIVKHYEDCLDEHGDNHLGVDWPKQEDVYKRYNVMLEILKFSNNNIGTKSLLDFGCGAGHLLEYINEQNIKSFDYSGLDLSPKFIALCKEKFPGIDFYLFDILENGTFPRSFDYVVLNGVFTEKRDLSFQEMWEYFTKMLVKIFEFTNIGIAFNVMSKAVEWERNDLFHVPTDLLIDFLTSKLGRKFIIRNDYGLFEYTTYVYK